MRARLADRLVRVAAWPVDRAYYSGQVHGHKRRERMWARLTRLTRYSLRLAIRIDAETASERIVAECWWG